MTNMLGIDEAGRGSVIGPLVIASAVIEKDREDELKKIGVRDSKLLTSEQRESMYDELKTILKDFMVIKISAKEIDDALLNKTSNLNRMESEKFGYIIKTLSPDVAIVDCPEVNTEKFSKYLEAIAKNDTKIICENKADVNHPIVAAASIIAKVERDREIEKIKKENNYDFGVGYPHDKRTIDFLKKLLEDGELPDFVRRSWATVENLVKEKNQKSIVDF